MFLRIWNYLRGYVIIEVSGFSVERFMNLAVHKGVYIWDVNKNGTSVTMKVSAKGFKLLKSCAKKTKCKIKIIKKFGAPFFAFRYRKRTAFAFGALFFVFILYYLSTFVWLIEIEGNSRVRTEDISLYCQQQGLKVGGQKKKFKTQDLQKQLTVKFPDISWININITGTKATIKLTEIIPKQTILDKSVPCDIIATKDGLITSIITSSGSPKVKKNDVVKKGDLLVSSELIVKEDETGVVKNYVHSIADIRAKMYYQINFSVPFHYIEKNYTPNIIKQHYLVLLDKNINFFNSNISFTNYDKITSRNQISLGDNYPLPVIIVTEEFKEFETESKKRTLEQAKELAEKMVTGRILREFDFSADVIDKQINFTEEKDRLVVEAVVTTVEKIDQQRSLDLTEEGNTLDGTDPRDTDTQ